MNDIKIIDAIVQEPGVSRLRRVTRKGEELPDEKKKRLLRKKRARDKKRATEESSQDDSPTPGDVDILV